MQIVKQSLVLSIHDVTSSTQAVVQEMLNDLKQCGVSCCSLLVVPHYHNKESLAAASTFVTWLHEKQIEGHEIVLHGWSHLRPSKMGENLWKRLMTQHYTRGEGEFYDLSYEDACFKLRMGKEEFKKAGFDLEKISGFIAPAWLLSNEAERAVAQEGFSYTTRLHGVVDLRSSEIIFYRTQSMVYSVSSFWRRCVSLVWNEILFRLAGRQAWSLLRIGLHPPDWTHSRVRKHALAAVSRAMIKRVPMTYQKWMSKI